MVNSEGLRGAPDARATKTRRDGTNRSNGTKGTKRTQGTDRDKLHRAGANFVGIMHHILWLESMEDSSDIRACRRTSHGLVLHFALFRFSGVRGIWTLP